MDKEYICIHTHTHMWCVCVCVCMCMERERGMWYTHTHTHTEYYSVIKKNEIMPFVATWMDLGIVILSGVSQTEEEKYCVTSIVCEI